MRLIYIVLFVVFGLNYFSQNLPINLKQFESNSILNTNDSTCMRIGGNWEGEEIQYDPTQSFIKVKFKVEFKLEQKGNVVSGTTYIREKIRGSYGYMKIRGVIIGNKFYFEEYDILNEKFFEKNVIWCLRSGILALEKKDDIYYLVGLDYNGYDSKKYELCTDYAKMSLKNTKQGFTSESLGLKNEADARFVNIYPNPIKDVVFLKYNLNKNSSVQIDVFDLAGKQLLSEKHENISTDEQITPLNLMSLNCGIYLIRVMTNTEIFTTRIVKSI